MQLISCWRSCGIVLGFVYFGQISMAAKMTIEPKFLQELKKTHNLISITKPTVVYCLVKDQNYLEPVKKVKTRQLLFFPKKPLKVRFSTVAGNRQVSSFWRTVFLADDSQVDLERCDISNGLYVSSTFRWKDKPRHILPIVNHSRPDSRFFKYFEPEAKIKKSKIRWFLLRHSRYFRSSWNMNFKSKKEYLLYLRSRQEHQSRYSALDSSSDLIDFQKSLSIYLELKAATNRTVPTPRKYMFLSGKFSQRKSKARFHSKKTQKEYGYANEWGAWDIAVVGTARRLGFGKTPCAEFVSEVVRQAYVRAGYEFSEDFNNTLENRLVFTDRAKPKRVWGPQSVKGLKRRLKEAGWIAWDPTKFQPLTGSIAMSGFASTPGHVYLIGGENGRIIVDNGNPSGLDLQNTESRHSKDYIQKMYLHSLFFLPPGIVPPRW